MSLTADDLNILRAPFDGKTLGVKVQSLNKAKNQAMLVLYLQHTDVQGRLEEVDPAWSCETLKEERIGDTVYVRMKMTVKGVSRENVGEGWDTKAAHSDALKRCAMLFGVGRYLYDTVTVWCPYNEQTDRFKVYTYADYKKCLRAGQEGPPMADAEPKEGVKPKVAPRVAMGTAHKKSEAIAQTDTDKRIAALNAKIMRLYRPYMAKYPETQYTTLLKQRYGVMDSRLLNFEQLEDFVQFLEMSIAEVEV